MSRFCHRLWLAILDLPGTSAHETPLTLQIPRDLRVFAERQAERQHITVSAVIRGRSRPPGRKPGRGAGMMSGAVPQMQRSALAATPNKTCTAGEWHDMDTSYLDPCTNAGAREQARIISDYWRKRGASIHTWVEQVGVAEAKTRSQRTAYGVRSDLINGLPQCATNGPTPTAKTLT